MRSAIARLMLIVTTAVMVVVPTATAKKDQSICGKAFGVRHAIVKKHGNRAPGRNICRQGVRYRWHSIDVKHQHWATRAATKAEKRKYYRALLRLNAPAPAYLVRTAAPPRIPPAGTMSASYAPSGLASCIVSHESGGNPLAQNGQYKGIAQWSSEAWARMGGKRYAETPHGATYQQQLVILSEGLRHYGCRDWCPYDGC